MINRKIAALFILSALVFPTFSPVLAAGGLQQILQSDQYKKVAEDVYEAQDGTPKNSIQSIIVFVINAVLGLLGVIFLVLILYAGFLWMTAGGNDEQVGKAKKLLTNSIIGVVVIVAAYAISYFVLTAIIPA
jgi:hypothetical protein